MSTTEDLVTHTAAARLPAYYIPHGAGPCFFMDWNPADAWHKTAAFLGEISSTLPVRPRGIVIISGHWEAPHFRITAADRPSLIYDYGGFPPHTYQLRYDAPGSPLLAEHVRQLLEAAGIKADLDDERGWDHGVFIPLKLIFADADIPVVQLSLKRGLSPSEHFAAGLALKSLRDQGVLLIGSGMSFHNMRGYGDDRFGPISDQFDAWLSAAVAAEEPARLQALVQWSQVPSGRLSHPREEHLAPLFVIAGAAGEARGERVFSDRVLDVTISAFRFD